MTHTESPAHSRSLLSAPNTEKDPTGDLPPTSLACNRKPSNGTDSALRDTRNTIPSIMFRFFEELENKLASKSPKIS